MNDIGSGVLLKSVFFLSTYVGSSVVGTGISNGFDVITH